MALPDPIPDNPNRWEGWRSYRSEDLYERLGLSYEENATSEQIEENCRLLLVWWQKKLPLKNQPSNPIAQMLRGGMDEAPMYLSEARSILTDPQSRARHDEVLREKIVQAAADELRKLIGFAAENNVLKPDAEERLFDAGRRVGLRESEILNVIDAELIKLGVDRFVPPPEPAPLPVAAARTPAMAPAAAAAPYAQVAGGVASQAAMPAATPGDPFSEFRRVLKLSRLCLDGEDMTDDQRDAMCNMGESLGLTGGQAEDVIDEYLEEVVIASATAMASSAAPRPAAAAVASKPATTPAKPAAPATPAVKKAPIIAISAAARVHERESFPNYANPVGMEMRLITSGTFNMGSDGREAQPTEQPSTPIILSRYFMSRYPVTNDQFEKYDPTHRNKRAPWADGRHPVTYVTHAEAEKFCEWLSKQDGKKYRLPTEAEWEYAARGGDGRMFPWGDRFDSGVFANFADKRTNFAWRDQYIDDGYAETAPVGCYPRGASPFGIEDLAGNVFEWCSDWFGPYRGKESTNPKGPPSGSQRVYRGGSWKSRSSSLRASARFSGATNYMGNDVGFRIICEIPLV